MHRALYRTYRPAVFSQVVGQEHITDVLRYQVAEGRTSHAYLFCGSRGTGKTTCAKILAKAINCLDPKNGEPCGVCANCRAIDEGSASDVLEMDAASNTGVDYIRDIKDAVMYAPTMLKCRVYIIDEVHMLSDGAFNALLKTLEEPPAGVVFILATTEVQKIPATILSRCQRFEFRRIAASVISKRLQTIAKSEDIELEEDAAYLIARAARGGMRDAISLLETCAAGGGKVDTRCVEELSGGAGRKKIEETVAAILRKDGGAVLETVSALYNSAGDLSVFWQELIEYYRDMMVCKTVSNMPEGELRREILDLTEGEYEKLKTLSAAFRYETLIYHMSVLDEAFAGIGGKTGMSGRIAAETALLRLTVERIDASPEALLNRIAALEEAVLYGVQPQMSKESSTPASKASVPAEKPKPQAGKKQGTAAGKPTTAPSEPSTDAPAEKPADQTSERRQAGTYLPFAGFDEVLHAFYKAQPSSAAFMEAAGAVISEDGQRIEVQLSSPFALQKLRAGDAEALLSRIATAQNGRETKVDLVLAEQPQGMQTDLFSELD